MRKIIGNVLPILLLCTLFFCIGYGLAESLDYKEEREAFSFSGVHPTQKTIYIEPPFETEDVYTELSVEDTVEEIVEEPTETLTPVPTPTVTPEPTVEPVVVEPKGNLIGSDFKLYHYAPTGNATASGRMPVVGTTVAVDPKYIKLGTWLRIEIPDGNGGYKVYRHKVRADDTGGDIKGHTLDIFVGSESEARQCGVIRNARVYIIEE